MSEKAPQTFESHLDELETILTQLEDGELPLLESIEKYRRGIEALKACSTLLDDARRTVEVLNEEAVQSVRENEEGEDGER